MFSSDVGAGGACSDHTCAVTCPWSYQPAVEEAPSDGIVEDQGPLTVHRLHHVLHGHGDVGVRARRVLVSLLPFDEEVGERARSSSLGDGQRLIVPAWDITHGDGISIAFISGRRVVISARQECVTVRM